MAPRQNSQSGTNAWSAKTLENRDMVAIGKWIDMANVLANGHDLPKPEEATPPLLRDVWQLWRGWARKVFALPANSDLPAGVIFNNAQRETFERKNIMSLEKRWFGPWTWNALYSETRSPVGVPKADRQPLSGTDAMELQAYRLILSVRSALDAIVGRADLDTGGGDGFAVELPASPTCPVIERKVEYSAEERRLFKKVGAVLPTGNLIHAGAYGEFLRALEVIDLRKIRRCRKCHRLFYALRSNKRACSPQCRDALRQQNYRAARARYEKNRRQSEEMKEERRNKSWLHSKWRSRHRSQEKIKPSE
jgi:hypothetical protein